MSRLRWLFTVRRIHSLRRLQVNRFSASWVRLGIVGMVVSFVVNMAVADPLPDPIAVVCAVVFLASFVLLVAGTVRAVRSRRVMS
jgi:hypothetical protein